MPPTEAERQAFRTRLLKLSLSGQNRPAELRARNPVQEARNLAQVRKAQLLESRLASWNDLQGAIAGIAGFAVPGMSGRANAPLNARLDYTGASNALDILRSPSGPLAPRDLTRLEAGYRPMRAPSPWERGPIDYSTSPGSVVDRRSFTDNLAALTGRPNGPTPADIRWAASTMTRQGFPAQGRYEDRAGQTQNSIDWGGPPGPDPLGNPNALSPLPEVPPRKGNFVERQPPWVMQHQPALGAAQPPVGSFPSPTIDPTTVRPPTLGLQPPISPVSPIPYTNISVNPAGRSFVPAGDPPTWAAPLGVRRALPFLGNQPASPLISDVENFRIGFDPRLTPLGPRPGDFTVMNRDELSAPQATYHGRVLPTGTDTNLEYQHGGIGQRAVEGLPSDPYLDDQLTNPLGRKFPRKGTPQWNELFDFLKNMNNPEEFRQYQDPSGTFSIEGTDALRRQASGQGLSPQERLAINQLLLGNNSKYADQFLGPQRDALSDIEHGIPNEREGAGNQRGAVNPYAVTNDIPSRLPPEITMGLGEAFWTTGTTRDRFPTPEAKAATKEMESKMGRKGYPLYSQTHSPAAGPVPSDAMHELTWKKVNGEWTQVPMDRGFTPKNATTPTSRYFDQAFLDHYNVELANVQKSGRMKGGPHKLLYLDEPIPPQEFAGFRDRFLSAQRRGSPADYAPYLKDVMSRYKLSPELVKETISTLRAGDIPTNVPAGALIDLLDASTGRAGTDYFLERGYVGGQGNARNYGLPKVPGAPGNQGNTNRKYLRLFQQSAPTAPPSSPKFKGPGAADPADIGPTFKGGPMPWEGGPDAGGAVPRYTAARLAEHVLSKLPSHLVNPTTENDLHRAFSDIGTGLRIGRRVVPTFLKDSLVPPNIRGVLHYLGGSGAPTDLGLNRFPYPNTAARSDNAIEPYATSDLQAELHASRMVQQYLPGIRRGNLVPVMGTGTTYGTTMGKGFWDPQSRTFVDDYRFYKTPEAISLGIDETQNPETYKTLISELIGVVSGAKYMGTMSGFEKDVLFKDYGRPFLLQFRPPNPNDLPPMSYPGSTLYERLKQRQETMRYRNKQAAFGEQNSILFPWMSKPNDGDDIGVEYPF